MIVRFRCCALLWLISLSCSALPLNAKDSEPVRQASFDQLFGNPPEVVPFSLKGTEKEYSSGKIVAENRFEFLRGEDSIRLTMGTTTNGRQREFAVLLRPDRSFLLRGDTRSEQPFEILETAGGKLWENFKSFQDGIGYRWWRMCYCLDDTFFYYRVLKRVTQGDEGCRVLTFDQADDNQFVARVAIAEWDNTYEIEFSGQILGGKPYIYRREWFPASEPGLSAVFTINAQTRELELIFEGRSVEKQVYWIDEQVEPQEFEASKFSLTSFRLNESGMNIPSIWLILVMVLASLFSVHWMWMRFGRHGNFSKGI